MAQRIRRTGFTWDPDQESHQAACPARTRPHLRTAGRLPAYARNLQMLEAAASGTSVEVIARMHGLKPVRAREINRVEAIGTGKPVRWTRTVSHRGTSPPIRSMTSRCSSH